MSLPRELLIEGLAEPEAMHRLILQAEEVLRTWQPSWSNFLSGPELENSRRLESLSVQRQSAANSSPSVVNRFL